MTQDLLALLALAAWGATTWPALRRVAPPASELPFKVLVATLACASIGFLAAGEGVRWLTVAVAGPIVLLPALLRAFARAGWWPVVDALTAALLWTPDGRDAARMLVAEVALQRGDAAAVLARLPREAAVWAARAHALRGDWPAVLAQRLPQGVAGAAGRVARVEALLATGRRAEAIEVAASLRTDLAATPDPLLYRAARLAEGYVDAEAGNLRRLHELLHRPPTGVPSDVLLSLLARAAERAGEPEVARRVHAEAYRVAPPLRRERHRAALTAWDADPLQPPVRRLLRRLPSATMALIAAIGVAFVLQVLLDRAVGALNAGAFAVDASSIAAAFVIGIPGFPEADALWRMLAYAFVHANLLHAGFNLWVAWDVGRMVEMRRDGGQVLAAFAAGAAMGALLTSIAQTGPLLLVGASGGVLGIAGALLADVSRRRNGGDRALLRSLLQWLAMIGLISLVIPNVSWWGHVGGVIGGLLWGFVRQGLPNDRRIGTIAGALAALALAWAFVQAVRVATLLL